MGMKESFNETFIDKNIAELSKEYTLVHAANVNLARIAPSIIDGLKLSARRLLYIMYLKDRGKNYRKVAAISGDTVARVHMHGQVPVEATLVNLAQPWNNIAPLIDGYGNYGSVSGDQAGASRYILARLSEYAYACFFEDWKESAVDMVLAADNETMEPLYLPAKYPNVLINGVLGIGVGMSSNIPPYCFKEVVDTTIKLMKNPNANFMLVPDSPTGCDIVASNFKKICETGIGTYRMRCKYEIDSEKNIITITAVPYQVTVNSIRNKIAAIKENNGLAELIDMQDHSGREAKLQLFIRPDVNPYKFMRKLISNIGGLEMSYPVNITVIDDYKAYDWSIRRLLLEWIHYRREQKRVVINHNRTTLLAEQRTNDAKIFILDGENLNDTIKIFRNGNNRAEIEKTLIERYRDTAIHMDSLQAKILSEMRMHELSRDSHKKYLERKDEIIKELAEVNKILDEPDGIDNVIIAELKDGVKRFGTDRRSNVVPVEISVKTEIEGQCILQVSSDANVTRRIATNVEEEPVPLDPNGFAVKVDNDSAFVAIDETGRFAFIRVNEIPVGNEVPLNRYIKSTLGKIVALVPYDIESDTYCTLISERGLIKKFKINEMRPSKKPCIDLRGNDKLVKGIVSRKNTERDILIFTENGYGQRLDPNQIRITSYQSKGINGFKLVKGDKIVGSYLIDPSNNYLLYVTSKGKGRLNLTKYLPVRETKFDQMVKLISLPDRDYLHAVIGCDKNDKIQVFFQDGKSEVINVNKLQEGTMSSPAIKIVKAQMISNRITKVKML